MEAKWQQLSSKERSTLLKKLFFDVLFNQDNLPALVDEKHWSDLYDEAIAENLFYQPEVHVMLLYCTTFFLRGQVSMTLIDYFKNSFAFVKVGNVDLFDTCTEKSYFLELDFNMQAVYLWMAQQENTLNL
jgi:hypothetical protein